MPRTRIKICGVGDRATAQAAVQAGADAIGLVFVSRSPRYVTTNQAQEIIQDLPAFTEAVGLFVDAPAEQVLEVSQALGLRTVQLHGQETPEYTRNLQPLQVIKAIGFKSDDFRDMVAPWRDACPNLAGVLFDAPPQDSELPGGTGRCLDWSALAAIDRTNLPPLILAGGLTPQNVAQAVITVHPWAVDVSSGVESSPGVKDPDAIGVFCQKVRAADARVVASDKRST